MTTARAMLIIFFMGFVMPLGVFLVAADIDTAGKSHAYGVAKAEKQGAYLLNGKIKMAALRADWK